MTTPDLNEPVRWNTCPQCLAHGQHLVLDRDTIDRYDCHYTGAPERLEWRGLCLEHRWVAIAHANRQRAHDHHDVWTLLETIELALAVTDPFPSRAYINAGIDLLLGEEHTPIEYDTDALRSLLGEDPDD